MARHNARLYGVEHRILFVLGDALGHPVRSGRSLGGATACHPAADEAQLLALRYVALRYCPLRGAMWRLAPSPRAEAPQRARLPPA